MTLLFIGTTELLLIALVALLLFGGRRLPELMRGLGKGVQSFRKGMRDPLTEEPETDKNSTETDNSPSETGN
ncbi:MAG: twin-arginine translocase TatA/TatE family subunit [Bacteroidales bacterium]|nr:twin-arginine translocase TatA/TatE family subunit [Bacteroidales bacterium]